MQSSFSKFFDKKYFFILPPTSVLFLIETLRMFSFSWAQIFYAP